MPFGVVFATPATPEATLFPTAISSNVVELFVAVIGTFNFLGNA